MSISLFALPPDLDYSDEQLPLYLCPLLRYTSAVVRSIQTSFSRARTDKERAAALDGCLTVGKLILNVIEPLARQADKSRASEYAALATALLRMAGPHWQESEANFPESSERQLLLDRMDQLDARLRDLQTAVHCQRKGCNGSKITA